MRRIAGDRINSNDAQLARIENQLDVREQVVDQQRAMGQAPLGLGLLPHLIDRPARRDKTVMPAKYLVGKVVAVHDLAKRIANARRGMMEEQGLDPDEELEQEQEV